MFKKATKKGVFVRMAVIGPSGSGKTYTSLKIATGLVKETQKRIAVVDTERGSASKYSHIFDFDVVELDGFSPENYINLIHEAEKLGYGVLVIDSLSHAWMGKDGVLEQHDKATTKTRNSFTAWREVTPLHNNLVEAMLQSKLHLIVTMRAKTEYAVNKDDNGKIKVEKIGLAPVQRDGLEYEFDIVADMDLQHNLIISKTRCEALDNKVFNKPGDDVANIIKEWLSDAEPVEYKKEPVPEEKSGLDKITDSQRRRLYAIVNEKKINKEDVKKILKYYGYESSNDITKDKYETIVNDIENFVSYEFFLKEKEGDKK